MPRDHEDRGERVSGDRSRSAGVDLTGGEPGRSSPDEPDAVVNRVDRSADGPHRGSEGLAETRRDVTEAELRPRQIEPHAVEVERRDNVDRRVVDEPVSEERRQADRRAVREREAAEARQRRSYAVSRVMMGVDYLFYLLYGLLGVRFVLALLGASETAGFVQFINGITQPFYAPFAGIVSRPAVNGGFLDFPVLIALLAYALLHMAIRGLLRLVMSPRA
jgi:YggT family protein